MRSAACFSLPAYDTLCNVRFSGSFDVRLPVPSHATITAAPVSLCKRIQAVLGAPSHGRGIFPRSTIAPCSSAESRLGCGVTVCVSHGQLDNWMPDLQSWPSLSKMIRWRLPTDHWRTRPFAVFASIGILSSFVLIVHEHVLREFALTNRRPEPSLSAAGSCICFCRIALIDCPSPPHQS